MVANLSHGLEVARNSSNAPKSLMDKLARAPLHAKRMTYCAYDRFDDKTGNLIMPLRLNCGNQLFFMPLYILFI